MKALLQLIRLPAGFSAISNILAAHLIASGGALQLPALLLTLSASLCLYFGGMALNDCLDYHEDCRERNNRPLPAGQISLRAAWFVSIGLMVSGLSFAHGAGPMTFTLAVILSGMIVLYNSKRLPLLPGAMVMGSCRYLNWLLGLSVFPLSPISLFLPLPLFFYVSGLTMLSEGESGRPSRSLLHRSAAFFTVAAVCAAGLAFFNVTFLIYSLPVLLLVMFHYARLLRPVWSDFSPASVRQVIRQLVMGVIIIDALILAICGYPLWAVCILLLLLPGKTIGRLLYVS